MILSDEESEKQRIIEKTLKECIIVNDSSEVNNSLKQSLAIDPEILNQNSGSLFTNLKAKIANFKDMLKFNIFSLNTYLDLSPGKQITIFNKQYNTEDQSNIESMNKKISTLLFFSYKKNFPFIQNSKNGNLCSSDSGWGCMIRSCQMILSRALYKIRKNDKNITLKNNEKANKNTSLNKEELIFDILSLFLEYPYNKKYIPPLFTNYIKKGIDAYSKNKNQKEMHVTLVYPPFGIKAICSIGEIFNKTAGEWFSDVNLPNIFQIINDEFEVLPRIQIIPFISTINKHELLSKCFTQNKDEALDKEEYIDNGSKWYLMKYGILFVSVRLGLHEIDKGYFPKIFKLFECKQCLGFVGGRNNSAHYFIGHNGEENVLYLDPHYALESVINNSSKEELRDAFLKKHIYTLSLTKLQCAFTIVFVFRSCKEYKEMINWIKAYSKDTPSYCCFNYSERKIITETAKPKKIGDFEIIDQNSDDQNDF